MGRPVRLLLDTHIVLWALMEPAKLPVGLRGLLEEDSTEVLVSAASAWEIATKYRLGKLPGASAVVADYPGAMRGLQAEGLAVTAAHALKAGAWEIPHRDPFDRMLAAQSALESLPLATTDPAFRQFDIELV